jgi:hypothetical protein
MTSEAAENLASDGSYQGMASATPLTALFFHPERTFKAFSMLV